MKVAVLGAGYVGLVTGVCLSKLGHEVCVLDVNAERVRTLQQGHSPIVEPGLDELMAECADHLTFAEPPHGLADAEVIMLAVGTPSAPNGAADMHYVREAVTLVTAHAKPGTTVVMKSTVPPGTGLSLASTLQASDLDYASNPEFLREGSAIEDFFEADRIVVGASSERTLNVLNRLYKDVDAPIMACDIPSAEMIKYASNAFLATKISFINEIANVCALVDADIEKVARGVGMDRRIGSDFLKAGIGYGGSCFPKDTRALDFLAILNGYDFRLLKAVIEVNARQRMLPLRAIEDHLGSSEGARIAILGLAFKPFTDDTRESPAHDLITMFSTVGAEVVTHDPIARLEATAPARQLDDLYDALNGAAAAVVTVEWPEYRLIDWARAASLMAPGALIYDGRNWLDSDAVRAAGLSYRCVGQ